MKERQDYKAWYYLPVPQETYDRKVEFVKQDQDKVYATVKSTPTTPKS
jgi:hypothetical protein